MNPALQLLRQPHSFEGLFLCRGTAWARWIRPWRKLHRVAPRVQLLGRVGSLVGLSLRDVAGSFGSSRALMSIVKLTASRTTALVTPAHAQGHDGNYSQDNQGNHNYNDSCLDGHRNHQGVTLLSPLRGPLPGHKIPACR